MEKKYFTRRTTLMILSTFPLFTIVFIAYPFIFGMELWFVAVVVPIMTIGMGYFFLKRFCFYPVFLNDTFQLRHALFASWTKEFKYSDIDFACVSKVSGNNGEALTLSLTLRGGERFGMTLMTAVSQYDELKSELLSHNISDKPDVVKF